MSAYICNLALSHLGISSGVVSLLENSENARAVSQVFERAVRIILRSHDWQKAKKTVSLALLEEDPNSRWAYSYSSPADCVKAIRIVDSDKRKNNADEIPFVLSKGDSGPIVFTDQSEAELEYIGYVDDTDRFDSDFEMALSALIAMMLAPRYNADVKKMSALYEYFLNLAKANDLNEQIPPVPPDSPQIQARI